MYNFDDKSGNTYEADKLVGYNPINNNSVTVGDAQYNFFPVPLKIWHGNADEVVSLEGTQKFVTALKNAGCEVYLRIVDGFGHDFSEAVKEEELYLYNRF